MELNCYKAHDTLINALSFDFGIHLLNLKNEMNWFYECNFQLLKVKVVESVFSHALHLAHSLSETNALKLNIYNRDVT